MEQESSNNRRVQGVYYPRKSDFEEIERFISQFLVLTKEELVEKYNNQKAIFGVYTQMVYLYSLHCAFMKRFGKSPLAIEEEKILVFTVGRPIVYVEELDTYEFVSEE